MYANFGMVLFTYYVRKEYYEIQIYLKSKLLVESHMLFVFLSSHA